ncbi:hypothetical protein ACFYVR_03705 [Rhodococcus sp. NPDC003318]|uniref:hypothetical protein n=1 Tax=Rhodococcus sp. NPDC003318 TaxID=3364503 RepID=UPI0036CC99BF
MNLARRFAPAVLLVAVAAATACSSSSAAETAAGESSAERCVDAGLPNATAEELVDVLRPQPAGEPDDAYRKLAAQFEESRAAQVARVEAGGVFAAVPDGGDAAFAEAVCGAARWDAATTPDGINLPEVRTQRAFLAAAGHTFCDTYEQLRPSAEATGAWSDWSGYVAMMTRGDDNDDARQMYAAALDHICPQFG